MTTRETKTPETDAQMEPYSCRNVRAPSWMTYDDMTALARSLETRLAEAEAALAAERRDAKRYRWLRDRVRGQRDELAPQGQDFVLDPPDVMPGQNIMRGSVAQHLDDAIDKAALAKGDDR